MAVFLSEKKRAADAYQGIIASRRKQKKYKEARDFLDTAKYEYPDHFGIRCEEIWIPLDQRDKRKALFAALGLCREFSAKSDLEPDKLTYIYLTNICLLRDNYKFRAANNLLQFALEKWPESKKLTNRVVSVANAL